MTEKLSESIKDIKDKLKELEEEHIKLTMMEKNLEEMEKANNCDSNLKIIKDAYLKRDEQVKKDNYSKSCVVAKFIDRDMVEPLKAIYNVLNNLNDRISKFEKNENITKK